MHVKRVLLNSVVDGNEGKDKLRDLQSLPFQPSAQNDVSPTQQVLTLFPNYISML